MKKNKGTFLSMIGETGFFLLTSLLIFAFVYSPGSTMFQDPVVFYIVGKPAINVTVLWTIYFIFFIFFSQSIKLDLCAKSLLLRILICILPVFYILNLASMSAHYPVVILSFIVYVISFNEGWRRVRTYEYELFIFGLILVLQVFLTFVRIDVSYVDLHYKSVMVIPSGGSNIIASNILPISLLYLANAPQKKHLKIIIALMTLVAVFLTKSRGGMLVMLIISLFYYLWLKSDKFSYLLFIIIPVFITLFIYYHDNPFFRSFILGYTDENYMDADAYTTGRLTIFEHELSRFWEHPIFGNGMIFNQQSSSSGAHNFIVELLVQSGVVGCLFFLIPVGVVLYKGYKCRKEPHMMGWFLYIVAITIHGLFEVNFFNYITDLLYWFGAGIIMSYNRTSNRYVA